MIDKIKSITPKITSVIAILVSFFALIVSFLTLYLNYSIHLEESENFYLEGFVPPIEIGNRGRSFRAFLTGCVIGDVRSERS